MLGGNVDVMAPWNGGENLLRKIIKRYCSPGERRSRVISLLLLTIFWSILAPRAFAYEAIITDDTVGANDLRQGNAVALRVRKNVGAYFRFDLYAEGLAEANIRRATLKLNTVRVATAGTVVFGGTTADWTEGGKKVPQGNVEIGRAEVQKADSQQTLPVDVTDLIRTLIANREEAVSFGVTTSDNADLAFYSKEGGRPAVLEIEVYEGAAGPVSFDLIRNKPTTLAGYGITDAASKGANSDITSLSGLTTPLTPLQGGTGSSTAVGARENLALAEPVRGLANLSSAAAGSFGTGSSFSMVLMGDSMTGTYLLPMTQALQSAFGIAGRTLGAVNGVTADGASFTLGGTAENAKYWPTGCFYQLPGGGTVTFSDNVTNAIVADSLRIYYVREPGAGRFRIQTELDLSGVWTDEDSVGTVNAESATIEGAVVKLPARPLARAYRMRVVGVSGTTKVLGCTMQNTRARGVVIGWLFANSGVGGDLVDGSKILMGGTLQSILTPVLQDVAPRAVMVHWRDGIEDRPNGAAYQSWTQLRSRWFNAYPKTDWILIGTAPYNVVGAADQRDVNRGWREYAEGHQATDTYVDAYTPFVSGESAAANGLLLPDGVHLSQQGSALLVNRVLDQLGIWQMSPQFLDRGYGDRLYSNNNYSPGVTAREVGQRAAYSIQGHRDGIKQLLFLNESEEQVGALSFMPENTAGGEGNEFVLSLGGVPSMKGTLYGGFAVGFNTPAPGAQFDINNGNPTIVALRVNSPSVQEADLTQWNRGGATVARMTPAGSLQASSIKVGGTGAVLSTVLSNQASLQPPAIPAGGTATWRINVPGAAAINAPTVLLGWGEPLDPNLSLGQAWVSDVGLVSVRVTNTSDHEIQPATVTVRATVLQFAAP